MSVSNILILSTLEKFRIFLNIRFFFFYVINEKFLLKIVESTLLSAFFNLRTTLKRYKLPLSLSSFQCSWSFFPWNSLFLLASILQFNFSVFIWTFLKACIALPLPLYCFHWGSLSIPMFYPLSANSQLGNHQCWFLL